MHIALLDPRPVGTLPLFHYQYHFYFQSQIGSLPFPCYPAGRERLDRGSIRGL